MRPSEPGYEANAGDEGAECGCERGELGERQLENALIESADVCPELLTHVSDVRREMSDGDSYLREDFERNLTRLFDEESVLLAPTRC